MIYNCGRSAEQRKFDIKSAFRLLIVNPADFDLLGMKFDNMYYIDKCLLMDCSVSCNLFEKFSIFLQWVVETRCGLHSVDHYLDDFILVGRKFSNDCSTLMNTLMDVCDELGVPIAEYKTVGPSNIITFLGFIIDTVLMMVRIPEEKLQRLRNLLQPLLYKKKVSLKDLESLTGLMAYCSRAILSSRAFIRRFYDLIAAVNNKKPHYIVCINKEVKADVQMWLQFLIEFNGQCYIPEKTWLSNDTLELFTDSSGSPELGCGAYFCSRWAQFRWPSSWKHLPIRRNMSLLEFIPVVLALYLWANILQAKKIFFHIDNLALVSIINKRTSKDKQIMKLVRHLVLLIMLNDIQFKATHINTTEHSIADVFSRFQMDRFRLLAPQAVKKPVPVPTKFWKIILDL
jgi:hypothetical protein